MARTDTVGDQKIGNPKSPICSLLNQLFRFQPPIQFFRQPLRRSALYDCKKEYDESRGAPGKPAFFYVSQFFTMEPWPKLLLTALVHSDSAHITM